MMDLRQDVTRAVVVGAGVVGLACAIRLQEAGVRTTLVAPASDPAAASWGNAGHIAVEQVAPLASAATLRGVHRRLFGRGGAVALPWRQAGAWLPFAARMVAASRADRFARGTEALSGALATAMPAWRRLARTLGRPDLLREHGHLVLWESPASAAEGRARWTSANAGTAAVRDLAADEIAAIGRHVAVPIAGGIRIDGTGQIADLPDLAQAMERTLRCLGGDRRDGWVRAIEAGEGRAAVRLADGTLLSAEAVIVAGGVASASLLATAGERVPMIAERGYHIQSDAPAWPEDMPPVVFEDRSLIVTRYRSGLRAASFVEFGRPGAPPDAAKWARLRAHVAALGLPFAEPTREWIGARPTLPDYLPAIGRSTRIPGLYHAFGHQHLGLTLAATTGEAVRAIVLGTAPPFDISSMGLSRFG